MSTQAHPDLDLLQRREPAPTTRRRRWLPTLTILVVALGGLAAVYAVLEPVLFPPRTVRIAGVRAIEGGPTSTRAGSVVEAAGWLESDPFPITVRPLVRGVVETLEVLEGQAVKKGETVIARLRDLELENALELAKAELALRQADWERAKTGAEVALSLLEQKLDLRAEVATLEGNLAKARLAAQAAKARYREQQAKVATATLDLEAQQTLERSGGDTPLALQRARARVREAEEHASELSHAAEESDAEVARVAALLALAREGLRDPRALQGEADVKLRDVARQKAVLERAQVALEVAQRNVDHLTVRAPVDGLVQRLEAAPGALVGPQGEFKDMELGGTGSTGGLNRLTGTLVLLYDPMKLQARVDVLMADVRGIGPGTKVELKLDAHPERRFHGVVDRLVHEADINKNTLQVKVRITDPDPILRPEMLCRVRFTIEASDEALADSPAPAVRRLQVPAEAVRGDAVFVFDPRQGGRARRVPVAVLGRNGDWWEVEGGLGLSSKVILDPVTDGEKVKVP